MDMESLILVLAAVGGVTTVCLAVQAMNWIASHIVVVQIGG